MNFTHKMALHPTPMKIFVRHCFSSSNSAEKERPNGFDRKRLFVKLLETCNDNEVVTVMLDTGGRAHGKHFTQDSSVNIVCMNGGSDSGAFRNMMHHISEHAVQECWRDDTIVVCLEDDFQVAPQWPMFVREGLLFAPYVTLYDHPDKYSSLYSGIPSQIYCGRLTHWRTTPSTVNSFATQWGTLREDMAQHMDSCDESTSQTRDHARFQALWRKGRALVSSIPGRWSHEEAGMQSPLWERLS